MPRSDHVRKLGKTLSRESISNRINLTKLAEPVPVSHTVRFFQSNVTVERHLQPEINEVIYRLSGQSVSMIRDVCNDAGLTIHENEDHSISLPMRDIAPLLVSKTYETNALRHIMVRIDQAFEERAQGQL